MYICTFLNRTDTDEMPLFGVITVCQSTCCKSNRLIIVTRVDNDQTFSLCLNVSTEDCQPPFNLNKKLFVAFPG